MFCSQIKIKLETTMSSQIVLDINGVLIERVWHFDHASVDKIDKDVHVIPMVLKKGSMHIKIRPFALDLIRSIQRMDSVDLVLWSSMTKVYMYPIVDLLVSLAGIANCDLTVMSQISCTMSDHPTKVGRKLFSKDIKKVQELFPDGSGVLFIDDSLLKMQYNATGSFKIVKPWDSTMFDDYELSTIIEELPSIVNSAKI